MAGGSAIPAARPQQAAQLTCGAAYAPATPPPLTAPRSLPRYRQVQVQTNGKKSPMLTVRNALQDLGDEVQDIQLQFQQELNRLQSGPQY